MMPTPHTFNAEDFATLEGGNLFVTLTRPAPGAAAVLSVGPAGDPVATVTLSDDALRVLMMRLCQVMADRMPDRQLIDFVEGGFRMVMDDRLIDAPAGSA